jgi:tetratricopeptide (TPR) repeat protein
MKMWDFWRTKASGGLMITALLLVSPAIHADENEDVLKLYKQGNLAKALEQADAYLASKPRDPQMRFNKGLILTEQNKTADAIKVFSSLSEEYPDLPEPYNNLAVLYASQGQYEKAREALEAAIRTHPSYSTAHENLGDIYAKMASQAYGKAFQLDKGNAQAQTKLAMIKDLFEKRPKVAAISAPGTPVPAASSPVAVEEKPSSRPDQKSASKTEKPTAEKPPAEKTALLEKPESAKPDAQGESGEILDTVTAWAKAWSDKDVPVYLGFYSSEFRAPGGASRGAWEKTRRERIIKPKSIEVSIGNPKVSFTDATHAKVSFRQSYHSDAIKSNTTKTLEMVKNGDKWQILHEQVGR